jgi:oligoribonuclease
MTYIDLSFNEFIEDAIKKTNIMYKGANRISSILNPFANINDHRTIDLMNNDYFQASEKPIDSSTPEDIAQTKRIPSHLKQFIQNNIEQNKRLAWIDCEMGGLDPTQHPLLEVSCVITELNSELDLVAEHETIVIHHTEEVIQNNFNEWCKENHAKSGLTERVRNSNVSLQEAEDLLLQFMTKFIRPRSSIAGNTVYMDKMFLAKYMPKLDAHLHYRCVDVSAISVLCKSLNNSVYSNRPTKARSHRARMDIYESIRELKWYQRNFFKVLKP